MYSRETSQVLSVRLGCTDCVVSLDDNWLDRSVDEDDDALCRYKQ